MKKAYRKELHKQVDYCNKMLVPYWAEAFNQAGTLVSSCSLMTGDQLKCDRDCSVADIEVKYVCHGCEQHCSDVMHMEMHWFNRAIKAGDVITINNPRIDLSFND